ncbi:hypothetical protein ARMGADRAFT_1035997 [Armillaria gallica]|uniref:Uncharacterized protein n=1 Tax=Armillaria gallica TaxID=47427 RepID=A0A2H3D4T4_ARMGA|nr:hypothetical protein ARMGADRAFT_1035997 [Armillaria gallica]
MSGFPYPPYWSADSCLTEGYRLVMFLTASTEYPSPKFRQRHKPARVHRLSDQYIYRPDILKRADVKVGRLPKNKYRRGLSTTAFAEVTMTGDIDKRALDASDNGTPMVVKAGAQTNRHLCDWLRCFLSMDALEERENNCALFGGAGTKARSVGRQRGTLLKSSMWSKAKPRI